MNHKNWAFLVFVLIIFVGFLAPSCGKKELKSEPVMSEDEARRRAEEEARKREQERQAAIREEELKEDQLRTESERFQSAREMFENEDILFEFDSASLSVEAQEILRAKAAWLRENPRARVMIEGHCDERGTNEYNLALGDRRAFSSKSFLVDLGIADSRLTTISYGEEQPVDSRATEDAWTQNRRAHFVIKE
ncbi:MAG: peptidoglycan-associated lipoprotein Pal [Desulfobacterales bacterium]|jgi:peptidoglycan-associated lipoprotein|nr:peptidoglycan-associated lipoprotein Pal [Desulfobacterales bacterium]